MSFQIGAIHLYNEHGDVREVRFRTGELNVITGASKTGKTALIEIVEYCLGSSRCRVPAGAIRDSVAWYALELVSDDERLVVARAAPGEGAKASEDVHVDLAPDEIPLPYRRLEKNTNSDGLKELLTRRAGIADFVFEPPEGQTRSSFGIQLRHALFFTFQRQDEIAAKDRVFHRQGEPFIPQTIRDSLPYFLGAFDDDRFLKDQLLKGRRRRLRLLQKRERETLQVHEGALQKGAAILGEAVELGLLSTVPEDMSDADTLTALREVAEWSGDPIPEGESLKSELSNLDRRRGRLLREFRQLDREVNALNEFLSEQSTFEGELSEQTARLESIDLFETEEEQATCPVCDSRVPEDSKQADILRSVLTSMRARLAAVSQDRPQLTEYQVSLISQRDEVQDRLDANRRQLESLVAKNERLQRLRDMATRRAHVAGRASLYVESVSLETDPLRDLREEIAALRDEIRLLENELDEEAVQERLASQLNRLGRRMSEWSDKLSLEHSGSPLRFDLTKLTVIADTDSGPVSLAEMGSGENWVGYHLILHLALHEWFVRHDRPVPRFLFLDQPTQVYFPPDSDVAGRLEELEEENDRQAVSRMFQLMLEVVEALAPDFQIIVTDHADLAEPWFQESVVERWRGGDKLIPESWLSD